MLGPPEPRGSCREGGGALVSRTHGERTKGKRHELLHGKFWLHTRKTFFTVRRRKDWDRLLREVVEFPSLEMIQDLLGLTGPQIT